MKRFFPFVLALVVAATAAAAPKESSVLTAAKAGDTAAVRALLNDRADPNVAEPDGTTALHWAVRLNDLQSVELLLNAGAKADAANRYGMTPLAVAATNGHAEIIERLLKAGADPERAVADGETALMTAARTGKVGAVKVLLAYGAKVDAAESWRGQTALMWAAAENNADAVRTLVEAGATIDRRSNGGFAPLHFAVRAGGIDAVGALLDAGADVNATIQVTGRNAMPRPPAAAQGQNDRPSLAQVLATGSRATRLSGSGGTTALHLAILNAHFELAAYLLERGANPNADGPGWTPLHQLAWTRRPPIQHGLPPAVPTGKLDSLELAKRLLDRGANPNARMSAEPADGARNVLNRIGSTPFLQAAKLADLPYMRLLAERGADTSITTEEGVTPLMAAAGVGIWQLGEAAGTNEEAFEAVKLCFELGNQVNSVDANGYTALHGAAHRGSNQIAQFLVDKGAKLDIVNSFGWTPFLIADGVFYPNTYNRRPETAALLLKLGADPKAGQRRPEDLPPSEEQADSSSAPK
jgi:ankyrin repeat protein